MYFLSASDLDLFYRCREMFRQSFYGCLNRDTVRPPVHMVFGSIIHAGCEAFWQGKPYREAFAEATKLVGSVNYSAFTAKDVETWKRLLEGLPEMLEAYFNHFGSREEHQILTINTAEEGEDFKGIYSLIEYEWKKKITDDVTLVGKIDHVFVAPTILADIKTASEIGDWKNDLRNQQARSTQFALYDWFLCESGLPPEKIQVEVITKPYKGKKCQIAILDITKWIVMGRERFKAQLAFKVREVAHWLSEYAQMKPWPMADSQTCSGKYSPCPFVPLCLNGETTETQKLYRVREEHLAIRKEALHG